MNYYTEVVADETIPCSTEDFEKLRALMVFDEDNEDLDYEWHSLEIDHDGTDLHLYTEESGNLEAVPDAALELIGEIITKAKKEYWQFGISYTASRQVPGSRGGCFARIYPDGSLVFSQTTWPDHKS